MPSRSYLAAAFALTLLYVSLRRRRPRYISNLADAAGDYDVIIIGGGTSGCALAARLSEDPSISVLLVEAGGRYALCITPSNARHAPPVDALFFKAALPLCTHSCSTPSISIISEQNPKSMPRIGETTGPEVLFGYHYARCTSIIMRLRASQAPRRV